MRFTAAVVALLVIALLAGSAGAFTYDGWRYGNMIPPVDARSLALGGSGIASAMGVRGMWLNPSLLGKTERAEVLLSASIVAAEEARDFPVHDSFDGILVYNTYALNTGLYDHYFGGVAYKPEVEGAWAPTVAIGYAARLDMNYYYHVQYRDPDFQTEPDDKIIADYFAEGNGSVSAWTVSLGQEVAENYYVGLGIDFLRGEWTSETRWVFPPDSDEADEYERVAFDGVSGTQFTLGFFTDRFHRWDFGAVYRSSFTLKGDYTMASSEADSTTGGGFEYKYPYSLAVGCQYHPRNFVRTTVSFDIEYSNWSSFEDNLSGNPNFDDIWVFRMGVDHGFFDNSFARFGFAYQPAYFDDSTSRAQFSVGLGLAVLGARVELGAMGGVREYSLGGTERLRETTTTAMVSAYHAF